MLRSFMNVLCSVLLIIGLCGCTTSGRGSKLDSSVTSRIIKNETNKQEVTEILGNPLDISHSQNVDTYLYEHVTTRSTLPGYCYAVVPLTLGVGMIVPPCWRYFNNKRRR